MTEKILTLDELRGSFQLDGNYELATATSNLLFETVLDVGFGSGAASKYFAINGKTVIAIDRDIHQRNAPLQR